MAQLQQVQPLCSKHRLHLAMLSWLALAAAAAAAAAAEQADCVSKAYCCYSDAGRCDLVSDSGMRSTQDASERQDVTILLA